MSSRRTARIARAVLETVSSAVLFEVKDPRVKNVTVLNVEVTGDVRHAKIYVSVMGDAQTQTLCLKGLESARGFLQAKIADRLQTRYTPVLKFVLDQSIKVSVETAKVIREALGENDTHAPGAEQTAASELSDDTDDGQAEASDA